MTTTDQILIEFEMQVSDVTELSTAEEFIVMNRVYNKICNLRPWEFLKTSVSGTMSNDATGYYITPPSDFAYFTENNNYTNNAIESQNNAAPKVIFVGSTYTPYQVVNFSDRRQYRNRTGFAYYDVANNKIRFTQTPESTTYEFDYVKVPTALVPAATPLIPDRFKEVLIYGMAVDNAIIEISPKATSYAAENEVKYEAVLADMAWWNANLILN